MRARAQVSPQQTNFHQLSSASGVARGQYQCNCINAFIQQCTKRTITEKKPTKITCADKSIVDRIWLLLKYVHLLNFYCNVWLNE